MILKAQARLPTAGLAQVYPYYMGMQSEKGATAINLIIKEETDGVEVCIDRIVEAISYNSVIRDKQAGITEGLCIGCIYADEWSWWEMDCTDLCGLPACLIQNWETTAEVGIPQVQIAIFPNSEKAKKDIHKIESSLKRKAKGGADKAAAKHQAKQIKETPKAAITLYVTLILPTAPTLAPTWHP